MNGQRNWDQEWEKEQMEVDRLLREQERKDEDDRHAYA